MFKLMNFDLSIMPLCFVAFFHSKTSVVLYNHPVFRGGFTVKRRQLEKVNLPVKSKKEFAPSESLILSFYFFIILIDEP